MLACAAVLVVQKPSLDFSYPMNVKTQKLFVCLMFQCFSSFISSTIRGE